jgi:glycosyltransferase involved in cell wall biosynthesis
VFDIHFVIQKEHSSIDKFLTKYALMHASSFVVHALHTFEELKTVFPERSFGLVERLDIYEKAFTSVVKLYHPIYDLYKPIPNFNLEEEKAKLGLKKHVFLYFGFIRRYKGLDLAIQAFAEL